MSVTLVRNATWSFGSALYTLFATLLVYRIVVSGSSAAALGVWSMVAAAVALGRISDFALSATHLRQVAVAASKGETEGLGRLIVQNASSAVLLTFCLVVVTAPFVIWTSEALLRNTIGWGTFAELLLAAAGSSLIGSCSLVVASTFDGLQLARIRAQIAIFAVSANCAVVYLAFPRLGILSLAVGQFAQYSFTVFAAVLILRSRFGLHVFSPIRRIRPLQALRFAGGLQLVAVFQQVFEYSAKYVFLRFGGAEIVGLFEVALRAVLGVRQIITSALSVLLPYSAFEAARENSGYMRTCMLSTIGTVLLSLASSVVIVGAGSEALSAFSGGSLQHFQWLLSWTCIAWIASLWSAPLFYTVLGEGNIRIPVLAAVTMLVVFGLLAPVCGDLGGWRAVAVAYACAVWVGTLVTVFGVRDAAFRAQYLRGILKLLFSVYVVFLLEMVLLMQIPVHAVALRIAMSGICLLVFLLVSWLAYAAELRFVFGPFLKYATMR